MKKRRKMNYIEEAMMIVQENENLEQFGKEWGDKVMNAFVNHPRGRSRGFKETAGKTMGSLGRLPKPGWLCYETTFTTSGKSSAFVGICIDGNDFGKIVGRLINILPKQGQSGQPVPVQPPSFSITEISSPIGIDTAQSDPDSTAEAAGAKVSEWLIDARKAAGRTGGTSGGSGGDGGGLGVDPDPVAPIGPSGPIPIAPGGDEDDE